MKHLKVWGGFLLFTCSLVAAGRFCTLRTEGFTCLKIENNFSKPPIHTGLPDEKVVKLLSQEFRYYKRGAQSFVFLSEDGNTVLKVFNNRLLSQAALLHYLPFAYHSKYHLHKRLKTTFTSYHLAATQLKKETGVLYAHLSPHPDLDLNLTLIDKLGIRHTISSKKTGFLLQKRTRLVYPALSRSMKEGNADQAKLIITSLINLVGRCHEIGVINEDPSIRKNFGLDGNRCIVLDVGRLALDNELISPTYAHEQKRRHLHRFRKWLNRTYPQLLEHFDKGCAE